MNAHTWYSQNGADSTIPTMKLIFKRISAPPKTSDQQLAVPVAPGAEGTQIGVESAVGGADELPQAVLVPPEGDGRTDEHEQQRDPDAVAQFAEVADQAHRRRGVPFGTPRATGARSSCRTHRRSLRSDWGSDAGPPRGPRAAPAPPRAPPA